MKITARYLLAAAAFVMTTQASAQAATYPDRPITLVIGFSAGGPTDVVGRYLAKGLEKELGQSVIVENRAGASGLVALRHVKQSKADGYTLLLGSNGALSVQPVYKQNVDYDVLKDFDPLGLVASYPYLLVVPGSSPYKSVTELLSAAKENKAGLTYASAGNGALNHLAAEWLKSASGANLTHVPYKGDSAALADVVAGRVDMAFFSAVAANPQIEAGKLRALAVATKAPLSVAEGLPTVEKETGIAGFTAEPWNGVLAPAGIPADVVLKLNAAINKVMNSDEAKTSLLKLGQYPFTGSPEEFRSHIASETANWKKVIEDAGIERTN